VADEPVEINLKTDVLDVAVATVKSELRVSLPGAVRVFNRIASRATAAFRVRFLDTTRRPRDEPDAPDLPVMFPGGGGYGFFFDPRVGDPLFVVAADGPVRGFYETGESVTPTIAQGHDYGCAVAFPAGRVASSSPGQEKPPPNATGEAVLGAVDLSAALIFRGAALPAPAELGTVVVVAAGPSASILLGGTTAAVPPACQPQVLANLQGLRNKIASIPESGAPETVAAIIAVKGAVADWFADLVDMADAKVRLGGPAGP
jgi:hypothetical protein